MTSIQQIASDMYDKLLDNDLEKNSIFNSLSGNFDGIVNCYVENTEDGNAKMFFSTSEGKIEVIIREVAQV